MIEIRDGRKVIITPVEEEDIRSLRTGDVIWVDGTVLTGRDSVHQRIVNEDVEPPCTFRGMVLYHAGPIVKKEGEEYRVVASGPTTSMRMEALEYSFIEKTGVRIIVGKGGMGENTEKACKEFGAVHCVFPAGCAVMAAEEIVRVSGHWWDELSMAEMVWKLDVKEFGPLVVSIDTSGDNLFSKSREKVEKRKNEAKERLHPSLQFMK